MRARDGKAGEILGEDHGTRLREGEDGAAMRVRTVSQTGRAMRAGWAAERVLGRAWRAGVCAGPCAGEQAQGKEAERWTVAR